MKLLIVESPAKAKTIEKYLDNKFTVRASVGHIRDLPKSNKKALDIPAGFVPHYEISKGKEKIVHELRELAEQADEVVLATDPDREGEAIAWHVAEALGLKKPKRAVFYEITKEAVQEALAHPREIDMNLKTAQEARRVLDRLFGYDLSGLIWKKVRYGLSAGRVQSPALRIIMEKEREIRAFVPEKYYVITGDFETAKKVKVLLTCEEKPKTFEETDRILKLSKKEEWKVVDVKESEAKRSARPPFITSTLQQSASSRLGYSPARTMGIAQKLYEAGHITYMRTDSVNISKVAQEAILKMVEKEYGKEYAQANFYKSKSKNAQEAHEAIRPSKVESKNAGGNEEQKKLYKLIWERAISSQMTDAKILKTKISANIVHLGASLPSGSEAPKSSIPNFSANGSRLLFPGWLKVDSGARGEDVELPEAKIGEKMKMIALHPQEKETTPPDRYTEAGLVKELEKRDIGRPSTYAAIIRTLEEREYMRKDGRTLFPTDTGEVVSDFLEKNFGKYISDTFTAEMEDELDEIAIGKRGYLKTLKDFYGPFTKDVKSKELIDKLTTLGDAPKDLKCPKCGKNMVIKLGRGGKFYSCSTYPECDGALTMEGLEIKGDVPIGLHPESQLPIFVKTGKYGPYVQHGIMEKGKKKTKPKMASIPKTMNPTEVTVADALVYLSLPKVLGVHPETGKNITASIGRFGPYVVHDTDFRSVRKDDIYKISLDRALEIIKEPKKPRGFQKKKKAE